MALPPSFARDGFVSPERVRNSRRLMMSIEGLKDTGKTELALSAPGPGILLALDRGFDAMLDNPTPPPTRSDNFGYKVITVPGAGSAVQAEFHDYWLAFYTEYKKALANPDARTVIVDGDSDTWELQRLAAFGKLTQIPSIMYTDVNAARRVMYSRAYDSGKIFIVTNKVKKAYKEVYGPDGKAILDTSGRPKREWDGESYERQGFDDQEYYWMLMIEALYRKHPKRGSEWGARIKKCKVNRELEGETLWGEDCNLPAILQLTFPNVDLEEWGYK